MPAVAQNNAVACHAHLGWQDSDGDRIPDIVEGSSDTDQDGLANHLDEDADGDGIPDASEAYNSPAPSALDSDNDGIDDAYDASEVFAGIDNNGDGVNDASLPVDSDQDGTPDFLDTDSDNDGLPDADEINSSSWYTDADTDSDGLNDLAEMQLGTKPNKFDTDDGGVSDWWESYLGSDPLDGADDHLHPDNLDVDKDGLPNDLEGYSNSDDDQIPDYLDLDSDNDGWYDIIEAGLPDIDGDGRFDDAEDINEDGLADAAVGLLSRLPDRDNDGIPNSIDLDADNDGLSDAFEMMEIPLLMQAGLQPLDIDADGIPNNLDRDSDGDGILDTIEAGYPDLDADGVADLVNDHDSDGIPDQVDVDLATGSDNIDTDADGIADRFDTDHSLETTTITNWTTLEQEIISLPNTDIDADGIVDRHDPDHNGDGQIDEYFNQQIQAAELTIDADGDGLIALRDSDDNSPFEPTDLTLAAALAAGTDSAATEQTLMFIAPFNPCPVDETSPSDAVDSDSGAMLEQTSDTDASDVEEPVTDTPQLGAAQAQSSSGSTGLVFVVWLLAFVFAHRQKTLSRR